MDTAQTEPLPKNYQYEQLVIGAALARHSDQGAARAVTDSLPADAFYNPRNRTIWTIIQHLAADSRLDFITFVEACNSAFGDEGAVIAAEYYAQLSFHSEAIVDGWVARLKELAHYRRLVLACNTVMTKAWNAEGNPAELEAQLADAGRRNLVELGTKPPVTIAVTAQRFDEHCARLAELRANGSELQFGIPEVDRHCLWIPSYGLVMARTSHGKTAFLATVAYHMAMAGKAPVVFSMEQQDYQFFGRLVSLCMQRGFSDALGRDPACAELRTWAIERLRATRLTIVNGRKSPDQIHAEAARLKSRGMCDAVLIDQMSRLDCGQGRTENKEQALTRASNRLVEVWKDLDVPLVLLAQLNKKLATEHPEPSPSHIKDCSSPLEDSCWQFMIDRPEADAERLEKLEKKRRTLEREGDTEAAREHDCRGMVKIICTKDRNSTMGGCWTEKLVFDHGCGHVGALP